MTFFQQAVKKRIAYAMQTTIVDPPMQQYDIDKWIRLMREVRAHKLNGFSGEEALSLVTAKLEGREKEDFKGWYEYYDKDTQQRAKVYANINYAQIRQFFEAVQIKIASRLSSLLKYIQERTSLRKFVSPDQYKQLIMAVTDLLDMVLLLAPVDPTAPQPKATSPMPKYDLSKIASQALDKVKTIRASIEPHTKYADYCLNDLEEYLHMRAAQE